MFIRNLLANAQSLNNDGKSESTKPNPPAKEDVNAFEKAMQGESKPKANGLGGGGLLGGGLLGGGLLGGGLLGGGPLGGGLLGDRNSDGAFSKINGFGGGLFGGFNAGGRPASLESIPITEDSAGPFNMRSNPEILPNDSQNIPDPTEHTKELDLGDKKVIIGSDGTASKEEVTKTIQSFVDMYENSPTFRDMIDNSDDAVFQITVGNNESDGTYGYGRSDGRLFLNIAANDGNIGNEEWQDTLAHEIAHAGPDLSHGDELDRLVAAAIKEA